MFYIYKTRWRVTYASCCCSRIFKTSLLALVIANGGKVQINAPWGLVISHPKSSAGILSTSYNMDINFFYSGMFTRDVLREIYIILNKN